MNAAHLMREARRMLREGYRRGGRDPEAMAAALVADLVAQPSALERGRAEIDPRPWFRLMRGATLDAVRARIARHLVEVAGTTCGSAYLYHRPGRLLVADGCTVAGEGWTEAGRIDTASARVVARMLRTPVVVPLLAGALAPVPPSLQEGGRP